MTRPQPPMTTPTPPAKPRRRFARALSIVGLSLVAATAVASVGPVGEVDVFDRPTAPVFGGGLPVLVLYASRGTEAASTAPARAIAEQLADLPYVTLVRVDLRDVPGLFHGIARTIIRASHDRSLTRTVEREAKAGRTVDRERLSARLLLVVDNEGLSHSAEGLAEGFPLPVAIVVDPEGREVARGTLPADRDVIAAALAGFRPKVSSTP